MRDWQEWSGYTNGQRIKLLRGKAITQAQLAEMTGLSIVTIRKAEQDQAMTLPTVSKVAAALGVSVSTVLGQTTPHRGATFQERQLIRRLSHAVHDAAAGDHPLTVEPADLSTMGRVIDDAWDLYGASNYGELGAILPPLLHSVQAAVDVANVTQLELATGALSDVFLLSTYLSNQLEARDVAYAAVSQARALAKRSADPLRLARVEAARSWVFRRDNRARESFELVTRAAAEIEPSYSNTTTEHLTAYGNLVNHCAVAASRLGQHHASTARDYLSQAHAVGARLGQEHRIHGGTFGPATATVKAVDVKLYTNDVAGALKLIKSHPDLSGLPPTVRDRYFLDVALAQCRARMWDASLDTLEEVCLRSPQWATHQAVPALIIQSIGAASTSRIRRIASVVGVQAIPRA
ncbi:helix-turn-helix domain-containing protein [Streptomyces lasiicapitis]|uniref:Transcriptional regulator n=1 Tax=Streptomyces lasiicapitis TaxID=1923961 RepID=A0ABQ2MUT6_9ACTN|nr:helix-turn-helix transcriptional regulator [Streptomyces lasiicapitis]GGO59056.1 transcriptional regulator [Streptomyces lasiicapitis]